MTEVLISHSDDDFGNQERRKRARYVSQEFQEQCQVQQEQQAVQMLARMKKRKQLEDIVEESRAVNESEIMENINVELVRLKRRKRLQGVATGSASNIAAAATSVTCSSSDQQSNDSAKASYDEETVRSMIGVALETQKEKLLQLFIDEHLNSLAELEQQRNELIATMQRLPSDAHPTYIS